MLQFPFFSLNGRIVPADQAVIGLDHLEYAYGFGVYENIRVAHGHAYFLDEHIARLRHSAQVIDLNHPYSQEAMEGFVRELLTELNADALNIKILLIGAKTPEEAVLAILPLAPRFPDKKWYKDGVDVVSVRGERFVPQAKTLNMLQSYLAYRQAKRQQAYDALLVDREGFVAEGTRTNLFFVNSGEIVTAPDEAVLPGMTRAHVLELARKAGIPIRHEKVPLADIGAFEGAFLTSTSSKVLPIRRIDDHVHGPIPEPTYKLMRLYDDLLHSVRAGAHPEDSVGPGNRLAA